MKLSEVIRAHQANQQAKPQPTRKAKAWPRYDHEDVKRVLKLVRPDIDWSNDANYDKFVNHLVQAGKASREPKFTEE